MTNAVAFTIPGIPVAKGRPRATTINGQARMYTPTKTVAYEGLVAMAAKQAMGVSGPIPGPVSLSIVAVWPIPASWSKKRRSEAVWKTSKPDADNVAKVIGDGCNGIVWADDSQVVMLRVEKRYGDVPGVAVEVFA